MAGRLVDVGAADPRRCGARRLRGLAGLVGTGGSGGAAWWRKVRLLRQHPRVPFTSKMIAYFVVGLVINVILAAASYLAGQVLRRWLAD